TGPVGAVVLATPEALPRAAQAVARVVADQMANRLAGHLADRQREQGDRGALALLAEASTLFAETLDVRLATTLTTQLVVPRFGTVAALLLLHEHGPRLEGLTCADETRTGALRAALEDAAGRALVTGLVPRLVLGGTVPLPRDTVLGAHAPHVLAVPLLVRRRLLGVLLVGGDRAVDGADASLLLDLGRRAAMAVDNARVYEDRSSVARVLQESLLPASLPTASGVAFGARYAAAGDSQVGGDFYDVFSLSAGGFGIAVGDVCGKGPEAAAITGLARQVLRLSVRDGWPLSDCFGRLNAALLELADRGRFLTGTAGLVQVTDEGVRVRLANAGHPLPVHVRADGPVLVGAAGDLLGVMETVAVGEHDVLLQAGESLVFYTDGVTERRDGDVQFGEAGLLRVLRDQAGRGADAIAQCVLDSVRQFSRTSPRDDLAVLVVTAG
ncbi:MAG: hypothetical protein JWN17_2191, partial [Frankiales bacterium]|nr:hypothetical protein [Frankiales bacterium]